MVKEKKHAVYFAFLAVLWTMVLAGCDKAGHMHRTLLHSYQRVSGTTGWHANDTIVVALPPLTENGRWDFSAGVRARTDFPYQGLWMVAETRLQKPQAIVRDTFYFRLTDPRGEPLTTGVNLMQREQLVVQGRPFFRGQKGEIRIFHLMRREKLPGIIDIGVKMVQTQDRP